MEFVAQIAVTAVIGFVIGYIACFFMMRNNPKYFHLDKMLKNLRDEKKAEFLQALKDAANKL